MEQPKIEKQQDATPQTVEDAVKLFISGEYNEIETIKYLRANREEINEFCMQTYESYQSGDKSGIIKLGMIIEKLL